MDLKIIENNNYKIISLKGSLDIYTSLDLKSNIDEMQIQADESIIFDLNEVDYVDSSGIGTLIKIVNLVQDSKAKFLITGLKPMIEKIFKVAGLMNYFTIISETEFKEQFPAS